MRSAASLPGLAWARAAPTPHPFVARLFSELDRTGVPWVLLRGANRLAAESGDVDLLVHARWLPALTTVARASGFVEAPSPGHGSHRFFLAYDREADRWVHLDVVTRLGFGRHQELEVLDAAALLKGRHQGPHAWELAGADALWALLLHYALDGAQLDGDKREELRVAAVRAAEDGTLLTRVREKLADPALVARAQDTARHGDAEQLAAVLEELRQAWPWRGAARGRLLNRGRRRLSRVLPGQRGPGLGVAVLGPDGAGKSSLIAGLQEQLPWRTHAFYIGVLRTTDLARSLRRIPGLMLLARVAMFRGRYSLSAHHRRRGCIVLFDRYTYDALMPVVRSSRRGGVSGAVLLRVCPAPDVTVVLDAPAELMWARKGELDLEQLEDFRLRYLALGARIPRVSIIDASQPADGVRRDVTELVYRTLLARQAEGP